MQKILKVYFFAILLVAATKSHASVNMSLVENSCKIKAKEIAAETYRNCVTENKTAQLDQLKNDYQQKLKSLKEDYEKEIQRLGGKTARKNPVKSENATLVSSAGANPANAKKSNDKKLMNKSESKDEMTMELKPIGKGFEEDQSTMDLPEPIPVEMSN